MWVYTHSEKCKTGIPQGWDMQKDKMQTNNERHKLALNVFWVSSHSKRLQAKRNQRRNVDALEIWKNDAYLSIRILFWKEISTTHHGCRYCCWRALNHNLDSSCHYHQDSLPSFHDQPQLKPLNACLLYNQFQLGVTVLLLPDTDEKEDKSGEQVCQATRRLIYSMSNSTAPSTTSKGRESMLALRYASLRLPLLAHTVAFIRRIYHFRRHSFLFPVLEGSSFDKGVPGHTLRRSERKGYVGFGGGRLWWLCLLWSATHCHKKPSFMWWTAPMPPQLAVVLLCHRIPANSQDIDCDDPNISEPLAIIVEGSKGALITTSRSH